MIASALAILISLTTGVQDPTNAQLQAAYDYLFSAEEQEEFAQLESKWDQERYWRNFWKRNDPTPETPTYNEMLNLFLRRFEFTYLFGSLEFEDGWKTDQGRVYILFGAPQEIHRSPFGPPKDTVYEIWVYKTTGERGETRSVEVVFQDPDNTGNFTLVTDIIWPRNLSENVVLPETREEEQSDIQ